MSVNDGSNSVGVLTARRRADRLSKSRMASPWALLVSGLQPGGAAHPAEALPSCNPGSNLTDIPETHVLAAHRSSQVDEINHHT